MVGRATFLIRTASLRYPRTARAIKRILGLGRRRPQAGATAWVDPTSGRSPKAKRTGEPHISFTKKSDVDEQDLVVRDTRHHRSHDRFRSL